VYEAQPLAEAADAVALSLALRAQERHLTIYAGAGLSMPLPTSLPSAAQLSRHLVSLLARSIDLTGIDPDDLVAVADRVAEQPQGKDLLHLSILDAADFGGARWNYAHEVLALLLCEGAATVLVTNYDDCIERSTSEQLVAVWSVSELAQPTGAKFLKVHGCVRHADSLLVTTQDLAAVPAWVRSNMTLQLYTDVFIFLGIGSPAEYVREGLVDLAKEVDVSRVHVVDPTIDEAWDATSSPSLWRAILPELGTDQRHAKTAEAFCDSLLRAYLHLFFTHIRQVVRDKPQDGAHRLGLERVFSVFSQKSAVSVLRWLRATAFRLNAGKSVTEATATRQGLLGLAALMRPAYQVQLLRGGCLLIVRTTENAPGSILDSTIAAENEDLPVLLLTVHQALPGTSVETEVRCRIREMRTDDRLRSGQPILVVVAGHSGRLASEIIASPGDSLTELLERASDREGLPGYLVAPSEPGHLLDGVNSGAIIVVDANSLFEAA
jgi:hypothetical protein